jgi:transposase
MRFYNRQHRHYCGIDLHVTTMYICILDATGQFVVHRNVKSTPEAFLETVAPYRDDLVIAAECMFTWYWLADMCAAEGIPFVLGHALAMKAIHGGKAKNDKLDSFEIATLLRGGLLPQAYVYPVAMRATRDLLRRRLHLVRKRGQLLAHIQNTRAQYQLPEFGASPIRRIGPASASTSPIRACVRAPTWTWRRVEWPHDVTSARCSARSPGATPRGTRGRCGRTVGQP